MISGEGVIKANNMKMKLKEEETIYISKGVEYVLEGNMELIKASV